MKIRISADTSCLINSEVLKKNGISEFPLNVIVNDVEYLDGVTINQEQLFDYMNNNAGNLKKPRMLSHPPCLPACLRDIHASCLKLPSR